MSAKLLSIALVAAGIPTGLRLIAGDKALERPNIVVILADDLGFADVGVHGCRDVPTPHIDSIAENGVRFTNGYAPHPVCAPSRAGLISGLYQHRFGFEHNPGPSRTASPKFGVPRSVPSLAEKLKRAGFVTGMVGKWHIGSRKGLRPHERGFDFSYGFLGGSSSYYADLHMSETLYRDGKRVTDETEYLTYAFTREAVAFIERNKDEPFFLYLAFNAVHAPLQAPEDKLERFAEIPGIKRRSMAGMHSAMDDGIGRVLETLRRNDLEERTLVIFYSDNGGIPAKNASRNDPLRGTKGDVFEGGIRVPFMAQWKGKLPAGSLFDEPVMGFDVHATALAVAGVIDTAKGSTDGVDLIPYLTGEREGRPHEQLFWRYGKKHAVRVGEWKLVAGHTPSPMLFNVVNDMSERTDLATEHPEKLEELQTIYAAWDAQMMKPQWTSSKSGKTRDKTKTNSGRGK